MMNIKVTKRSGSVENLALEKWQAQVAKICEGVSDVSQSMIEITSQPHFFDGITTREIDELTLRAIVDLIDAGSQRAARAAIRTLEGEFSRQVSSLCDELISLRVYVESALGFCR